MDTKHLSTHSAFFFIVGILAFTLLKVDVVAFNYSLSGADWDATYCLTGSQQSPINIAKPYILKRGTTGEFRFNYTTWSNFELSNTGHVIEVVPEVGTVNLVHLLDGDYELQQFHVHAPSEHTVDGQLAAMEMHLVHLKVDDSTVYGVVSLLFHLDPEDKDNAWLNRFITEIPTTVASHEVNAILNPMDLIEDYKQTNNLSFYTYSGSLTTPTCAEGVHWYVLKNPKYMSVKQLAVFLDAVSAVSNGARTNNRLPQPLNGRIIDSWDASQKHHSSSIYIN